MSTASHLGAGLRVTLGISWAVRKWSERERENERGLHLMISLVFPALVATSKCVHIENKH